MDSLPSRATLVALVLGLLLPACDNPACVFSTTGCNGSGTAVGQHAASIPNDGEWIQTSSPSIQSVRPSGTALVDVHTPVVVVFSESIAPTNPGLTPPGDLASAFELQSQTTATVDFAEGVLVGDGRVLILFPQSTLLASTTYSLVLRSTSVIVDRTGQGLPRPSSGVLGTFGTLATAATGPAVLATWPVDASTSQSGTTEIDVVFDRPVAPASVTTDSFAVTVNGSAPTFDPPPHPLSVGTSGNDDRVFVWRSLDGQGVPADLGQSASLAVDLSPVGHEIHDAAGANVAETQFSFDTAAFSAPLSAAITSVPTDAIGIQAISGPADLAVQVQLSGAQDGDRLVLTLFGIDPTVVENPSRIALQRDVALVAPFDSFTMTASEVDLLAGSSPVHGKLADGTVAFAFQLRRGSTTSPVRMMDVDTTQSGVQSPRLDTVPPHILGMGTSGLLLASLSSDLRDVVLYGRASERILRAEVVTVLGDNEITTGQVPPVVGSTDSGLFIAAPVRVGIVPAANSQLDYTLTIYDAALNATTVQSDPVNTADGFHQVGASGPGTPLPGGNVTVEVFDASTLLPVVGAEVWVHRLRLGAVTAVNTVAIPTNGLGIAIAAAANSGTTLVTVRKTGYDLFTFQGVPTSRVSIPLSPANLAAGSVTGTVGPLESSAASDLNTYTRSVADSRQPEIGAAFFPVASCDPDTDPETFDCPFGPIPVRVNCFGAESAITVRVPTDASFYSPLTFLKTAAPQLPLDPVLPSDAAITSLPIPFLLDAGTLDPEELPIDVPPQVLSTSAWPGLPSTPVVTVEATAPGIAGTVTIGAGVAFSDPPPADNWMVRAAYPGAADGIQDSPTDKLGSLVTDGTIDADLMLGVRVADAAGNQGGSRRRFSRLSGFLAPPAPPVLPANPISPNAGGEALDLTFPDALPDSASPPGRGIYRIRIDAVGRSWTIYVPDSPDSSGPNVVVRLPDLGGAFPLPSGSSQCRISGWSWPTFDVASFLWTDIEREHDLSFHSALQSLTIP